MIVNDYLNYILVIAVTTSFFSIYYLITLFSKIKQLKFLASLKKLIGLSLFSSICLTASLVIIATQGYQALTQEEVIATISVVPQNHQHFIAVVEYSSGGISKFELMGDEIMVDANILKWNSWANVLGLKTAFKLSRIRGRYKDINDEKTKPATIFELGDDAYFDISDWRSEYQYLSYLLDVEHGSVSYQSIQKNQMFQLVITNSGLLLRPIK
jgi:hypothetical protein